MNRRGFLKFLGLGVAGAIVAPEILLTDPERELWVPGAKTIVDLGGIRPYQPGDLMPGDIFTIGTNPKPYRVTGNTFVTPEWVTKEAIRVLNNTLAMLKHYGMSWEDVNSFGKMRVPIRTNRRMR